MCSLRLDGRQGNLDLRHLIWLFSMRLAVFTVKGRTSDLDAPVLVHISFHLQVLSASDTKWQ